MKINFTIAEGYINKNNYIYVCLLYKYKCMYNNIWLQILQYSVAKDIKRFHNNKE